MKSPAFTPGQIRTAYNFPTTDISKEYSIALLEFGGESVCDDAVTKLASCYQLTAPTLVHSVYKQQCGDEAATDAAAAVTGAPGNGTIYVVNDASETWATSAATHSGFMTNVSAALAIKHGTKKQPVDALSISYQTCERSVYTSSNANIEDAEKIFAKAALMQVTVTTGAGDWGSSGSCATSESAVSMSYPATSAYVTAVGGTNLYLNQHNVIVQTLVWNQAMLTPFQGMSATGGGVSGSGVSGWSGIPRPSWQKGAGVDLSASRQVPDVSYIAANPGAMAYFGGAFEAGGTSYAAPLFASAALHYNMHNNSRLGLATRLLYSGVNGKKLKFHDITESNNKAFPYKSSFWEDIKCCTAGAGFDTASGLGSVDISSLVDYAPSSSGD